MFGICFGAVKSKRCKILPNFTINWWWWLSAMGDSLLNGPHPRTFHRRFWCGFPLFSRICGFYEYHNIHTLSQTAARVPPFSSSTYCTACSYCFLCVLGFLRKETAVDNILFSSWGHCSSDISVILLFRFGKGKMKCTRYSSWSPVSLHKARIQYSHWPFLKALHGRFARCSLCREADSTCPGGGAGWVAAPAAELVLEDQLCPLRQCMYKTTNYILLRLKDRSFKWRSWIFFNYNIFPMLENNVRTYSTIPGLPLLVHSKKADKSSSGFKVCFVLSNVLAKEISWKACYQLKSRTMALSIKCNSSLIVNYLPLKPNPLLTWPHCYAIHMCPRKFWTSFLIGWSSADILMEVSWCSG